jgi:hypothetical protein
MLVNPFTPSEIASNPEDFFGRFQELQSLERGLTQGSVAIQGAVGIGKSSLLARARLLMEGFDSHHTAKTVVAVGDKDVKTVDDAARLLLECFMHVDEAHTKVAFRLGSIFEVESAELCRNYANGRHLASLKRVVEKEFLGSLLEDRESLVLAVDEADKCPVPLARLIRSISTHTQHQGVKRVRFLLAGVSPFFRKMVTEDSGVGRFFYKTVTLKPMRPEEATELMESKLALVSDAAAEEGVDLRVDPEVVTRVVSLAGGHPHLLQLLGSHLVTHEIEDPDGTIDSRDLVNSLRRICYEDRVRAYDSTMHMLDLYGRRDALSSAFQLAMPGFPTRINRRAAAEYLGLDEVKWLMENDILCITSRTEYGLVDEFLRIRFLFDQAESAADQKEMEKDIVSGVSLDRYLESEIDVDEEDSRLDYLGFESKKDAATDNINDETDGDA